MARFPGDVRALFPALRQHAWLNAAASSPLCTPVADAVRAVLDEAQRDGDLRFIRWLDQKERLRAGLAALLNAASPGEVGLLGSTSHGFSAVAQTWAQQGVREVLVLRGEFPSTTVPLLQAGLAVRAVAPRPDGSTPLDDLLRHLPRVGAVAVSAVEFASGFRVDLPGLAAACRAQQVPLALNAAQALGQVPLDVQALGCDFLCAPSHKWLMGGFGVGVFYARAGTLDGVRLPWAGWLSPPDSLRWNAYPGSSASDGGDGAVVYRGAQVRRGASGLDAGTGNWPAFAGALAAVELLREVGVDAVQRHALGLQARLRQGLRARGFSPNAPDDPAVGSGICVVPVAGEPLEAVRALVRQGVVTTPRGVGLRISTHVYNAEEDVDRLLRAIDAAGVRPG